MKKAHKIKYSDQKWCVSLRAHHLQVLDFQGLFYFWYASFDAAHILKNSLISCAYENWTIKNKQILHTF